MNNRACHGSSCRPSRHTATSSSPHAWGTPHRKRQHQQLQRFIPTCVGNTCSRTHQNRYDAVHPHMRGEHDLRIILPRVRAGLSPHAWGTRLTVRHRSNSLRFIPTCVGNTAPWRQCARSASVHPHMRGEHSRIRIHDSGDFGSSPHAWGTLHSPDWCQRGERFIPTCVGNTLLRPVGNSVMSVHPHMRGEHHRAEAQGFGETGSFPHAWGTPSSANSVTQQRRFIPTCVGNTRKGRRAAVWNSVHPHMRGEHLYYSVAKSNIAGSSPHAWGTQLFQDAKIEILRFIPTCVGNTIPWAILPSVQAVHPHMRGEHALQRGRRGPPRGSSPHAWGTRERFTVIEFHERFIPTCVGNTPPMPWAKPICSVHPHMRGEHGSGGSGRMARPGSSPHAWGTHYRPGNRTTCRLIHPHMRGEHGHGDRYPWWRLSVHPHMRGEHPSHNQLLKKEKKERVFSTDKNR
jgi:hypothetical protein